MRTFDQHPGHYASLLLRDSNTTVMDSVLSAVPVTGFMSRMIWTDTQVVLDQIGQQLDWCARQGAHLIVMLCDKSFDSPALPAPAYLARYAVKNQSDGFTMIRWQPEVRDAFREALRQIYTVFGSHLAFEGVALQETAPSLDADTLKLYGYTPDVYAQMYIGHFATIASAQVGSVAQPAKRMFWFQNFFPGKGGPAAIDSVLANVDQHLVITGPDVCPFAGPVDMTKVSEPLITDVYPRYTRYPMKLTMAHFSLPSYAQPTPNGTMGAAELVQWSKENLQASYFGWTYGAKSSGFASAVPLIKSLQG